MSIKWIQVPGLKESLARLVLNIGSLKQRPEGSRLNSPKSGWSGQFKFWLALPLTRLSYICCSCGSCTPTNLDATFTSFVSLRLLVIESPLYHTTIRNVKTDSVKEEKKSLRWAFLQAASVLLSKDNLLSMVVPKYLYSSTVSTFIFWVTVCGVLFTRTQMLENAVDTLSETLEHVLRLMLCLMAVREMVTLLNLLICVLNTLMSLFTCGAHTF